jgi:hypothetical protein
MITVRVVPTCIGRWPLPAQWDHIVLANDVDRYTAVTMLRTRFEQSLMSEHLGERKLCTFIGRNRPREPVAEPQLIYQWRFQRELSSWLITSVPFVQS